MRAVSLFRVSIVVVALGSQRGLGQTTTQTTPKPKSTAKVQMAVWTPDVQKALGVSSAEFKTDGLNRLTEKQLEALEGSTKSHLSIDPKKKLLSCTASSLAPGARIEVWLTVAGDDPTGQRAAEIQQSVRSLSGVDLVTVAASADRALHVVIQEQTLGKRTIGYTASYMTSTPCVDESGGKKADVELKGQLGTYTEPKGADLARDLAGMLDQDLQPLRGTAPAQ